MKFRKKFVVSFFGRIESHDVTVEAYLLIFDIEQRHTIVCYECLCYDIVVEHLLNASHSHV